MYNPGNYIDTHVPTPARIRDDVWHDFFNRCIEEAHVKLPDISSIMFYLIPVLNTPRKIKSFAKMTALKYESPSVIDIATTALEVSNIKLRCMLEYRPFGIRWNNMGTESEINLYRYLRSRLETDINIRKTGE